MSASGTERSAKPVVTQATPATSTNKVGFIFFILPPLNLNREISS